MLKSVLFLLTSVFCALNLQAQTEPQKTKPLSTATPPAVSSQQVDKNPPPIDVKNMDTSVKPEDDFYLYANGNWIKNNPIPPEFSRWGSFNELAEKNNDALHVICEKAAANAAKQGSKDKMEQAAAQEMQKVGDYYASGMDEKAIDAAKIKPLQDELKLIDSIKTRDDVLKEIAHLHTMEIGAFFVFTSQQDRKNSTMVIGIAHQGGLGLPDRDYYTKDDDASKKLRDQYVEHVAKMLTLAGEPAAMTTDHAKKILALENSLAVPARTRVELRNPQKNYNKMSQAEMQTLTPDWNWKAYFEQIKLTEPGDINIAQPDFFKAANDVFAKTSIDDWKTYLRWHLVHSAAAELSKDFVDEDFRFYETVLRGTAQIKPRWKRVVASTDTSLGEALGKLYVADNFPPAAKQRALELVNNLKEALSDRIKQLDWMDDATKQEALKKLAAMNVKIGYPDKWRDYSTLKIDRGPFVLNAARGAQFENDRELKKIGKPVDRSEWGMTPPTVNAYYNPTMNEIVFPAGILQPPFFFANADDAVNYGGIGCVIGHEMTHGFDDQGRQYDAQGNLRDWWTKESADAYNERRKVVVEEYSEFEPLPGEHVNGELTQGENIADIGGVRLAYMALQKAMAQHPAQGKIDGFTPEQRFFLAYAQIWRMNIRDQEQKLRLTTDPHSPGRFRTIGPLSNFDEFAKAFDIPAGAKVMRAPEKRVNIW